jgi:TolB protein
MRTTPLAAAALVAVAASCFSGSAREPAEATTRSAAVPVAAEAGESHLANVRRLTHGGENAEAYFSSDGRRLIFQSTRDGRTCDQQYIMNADGGGLRRVSTGTGKTTCGYFMDGDRRIVYASTHAVDSACPPRPDPSRGYVWRLDPFDLYVADASGANLKRLTNYGVYTAEATLSPDGKTIVFTSLKDGDLDIYTMRTDGSNLRRLTTTPGYDGGAFFSPDGRQIVYRAWHWRDEAGTVDSAGLATYRALLADRLVRPNRMEIWVMNADGTGQRQVTRLGSANFAPFFTPDGRRILFSSNHHVNPRSGNFDLFVVDVDGTGLEQVTTSPVFDGFPQFSPDGKRLVWASNRHSDKPNETNIFVADWVE